MNDFQTTNDESQPYQHNGEVYESYESPRSSDGHDATAGDDPSGETIEKVNSKVSVNNVAAIPNGGLRAWLQVLGAFTLFFNNWGILNTFGSYQTYYESGDLFEETSSTISWIGAIQACLLLLVGALTGPLYDKGYFNTLLRTGSFMVVLGQMMLSLCTEFWQVLLAQAFCIGIGAGFLFVPSVAILSTYFNTKIAFAVGLAASGSSLGGIIYPIVFHRLQPTIGFAWTTRVLGFIMLATLTIPLVVMKVRVLPAQRRALFDLSAFREVPYVLYVLGSCLGFMGLYIPFFYIQYYGIQQHIVGPNLGFYLLPILNATSVFGRIIPNFFADKTGPLNMLIPCAFIAGLLTLCLLAIHSEAGVIAFGAFYGFFSGTFVSLPPTIYVSLSPTRGIIGTRMGMGFSITSIGVLVGTPIGGAILGAGETKDLNFVGLWLFGGILVLASGVFFTFARFWKTKWKIVCKA